MGRLVLVSRVVGSCRSEIVELPDLVAEPGRLVVEVLASGVCTSDLPSWRGGGSADDPVSLGHEVSGRVQEVCGPSRFRPGDLVTGLADHGFATQVSMLEREAVPIPAGVEPALCIGEPFACLVAAIDGVPAMFGERIAVVGAGFMGLGLVQLARLRAPEVLMVVDPSAEARDRAMALGADVAYAPDEVPAGLDDEADARVADARMDLVLEAAGVADSLALAVRLSKPFGVLNVVGYHHYSERLCVPMDAWYKGLTIRCGFAPSRDVTMTALGRVVDLLGERRISQESLITHRFGLDGVDEAFELMESRPNGFVKSVVEPAKRRSPQDPDCIG